MQFQTRPRTAYDRLIHDIAYLQYCLPSRGNFGFSVLHLLLNIYLASLKSILKIFINCKFVVKYI